MPFATEDDRQGKAAVFTREPVGPKNAGSKGSIGDTAVMDAICIVVAAWVVLFFLAYSLRRHNI